jgi:hypothetical protein
MKPHLGRGVCFQVFPKPALVKEKLSKWFSGMVGDICEDFSSEGKLKNLHCHHLWCYAIS